MPEVRHVPKQTPEDYVSSPRASAKMTPLVMAAFAAVYVIWGSTYLGIRIAIETFPPLVMVGIRHLMVGCLLYPVMRWKTGLKPTGAQWRAAAVTGLLLLFLSNGGLTWAEQVVPTGVASILVATVSLWLVLLDWLRPGGTRPAAKVVAGLVLGFAGLALLVGPAHLGGSGRVNLTGAAILVGASLCWAFGSLYSKHNAMPSAPLLGVAMQSISGGLALCIAALLSGEYRAFHFGAVSLRSWLALGYLIFIGSGVGYSAYIYILQKSTAARVATYAFVNPVVALFLGWLVLSESITLRTILSAAVILTAVFLVITAPHSEPLKTRRLEAAPEET
jgi:drug/metabolite transporter (DMT)-like permease